MINHGKFRQYSALIGKSGKAANMHKWYGEKKYETIIEYIRTEAAYFINAYQGKRPVEVIIALDLKVPDVEWHCAPK